MENTFDWAREGLRSTGASADIRDLIELLARHGEEEGAILSRYQRFAEEASAPETRFLVNLIVDDERRHHSLLIEMANAIAWGLVDKSANPVLPDMTHKDAGNAALEAARIGPDQGKCSFSDPYVHPGHEAESSP
jgi:hypothetical protein